MIVGSLDWCSGENKIPEARAKRGEVEELEIRKGDSRPIVNPCPESPPFVFSSVPLICILLPEPRHVKECSMFGIPLYWAIIAGRVCMTGYPLAPKI